MPSMSARDRILENPFYVLGLRPDCSRIEVEREGQVLLGMLALNLTAASRYRTPLGMADRTPEKVRQAMAELRDPKRRLEHELWATLDPAPLLDASSEDGRKAHAISGLRRRLGWGRR